MQPRTIDLPMPRFLPVRTLSVEVVAGPDAGARLSADSETATVGTAAGNVLALSDESVSRYHLELTGREDGVHVVDCGSTNGTLVAGVRIERGVVPADAVLSIGRTKLRVGSGKRALVELHGDDRFGALRGRTPVMRRLMAQLDKAAQTDIAVLLVGESGTGKELIAEALHERGRRAEAPFVTVDCGALAPSLVASELFGHERGAFTGADARRLGAFERAHGGTLFLDEVGELPGEIQSALLGVLERRRFLRVGGREEIAVDVRVVSATHRDLRAEVNEGRFRLDLYYRLAVMTIEVPPLRARLDDLPLLVEHFLEVMDHPGTAETVLGPDGFEALTRHHWPGNVRELRNLIEASVALGEIMRPTPTPAPPPNDHTIGWPVEQPYNEARASLLEQFEQRYLASLLARTSGNVSEAARWARMNRSHLFSLLRKHRLR